MGICYYIQRSDARVLECSKWLPWQCIEGIGDYNGFAWTKIPYATAESWIDAIHADHPATFEKDDEKEAISTWCRVVHAWADGKHIRWADDEGWYEFTYSMARHMGASPPGFPAIPLYPEMFGKDDIYELAKVLEPCKSEGGRE